MTKFSDESGIRKVMRALGCLLGFVYILFGPWLLVANGNFGACDILICLTFVLLGASFLNYGITGRSHLLHRRSRMG